MYICFAVSLIVFEVNGVEVQLCPGTQPGVKGTRKIVVFLVLFLDPGHLVVCPFAGISFRLERETKIGRKIREGRTVAVATLRRKSVSPPLPSFFSSWPRVVNASRDKAEKIYRKIWQEQKGLTLVKWTVYLLSLWCCTEALPSPHTFHFPKLLPLLFLVLLRSVSDLLEHFDSMRVKSLHSKNA